MRLIQLDQPVHAGGVTYDAYTLQVCTGETYAAKTRVSAQGTEFFVSHHPAFQAYWKQVSHYYFRIRKDTDSAKGYFLELHVERPFNTAPSIVTLD